MLKQFSFSAFCLVLIAFLAACGNEAPATDQTEKMIQAYCECASPLLELNKQALELSKDSTKTAELTAQLEKIQVEFEKSKDCAATIVARYGKLKPADLAAANKILATKCPDLAQNPGMLRELMGE